MFIVETIKGVRLYYTGDFPYCNWSDNILDVRLFFSKETAEKKCKEIQDKSVLKRNLKIEQ